MAIEMVTETAAELAPRKAAWAAGQPARDAEEAAKALRDAPPIDIPDSVAISLTTLRSTVNEILQVLRDKGLLQ